MDSLFSIKDVMETLCISRRTVYYWIENKILTPARIGKVYRFDPGDIRRLLNQARPSTMPPGRDGRRQG